jgi:hypothetical protein
MPNSQVTITNPILGNLGNPNDATIFLPNFISGLIGLAFVAGAVIFFFVLILGAIQWISAGGDKQALEGARSKITNAVIGIIILFSLYAIINLIQTFFGITIMNLNLGALVIGGGSTQLH